MRRSLCLLSVTVSLLGCHPPAPPRFQPHTITLNSGQQLFLIDHRISDYTLHLRYETHIPLSNVPALQAEAFEVFRVFRADAESKELELVRVTPQNGSNTSSFLLSRRLGSWEFQ